MQRAAKEKIWESHNRCPAEIPQSTLPAHYRAQGADVILSKCPVACCFGKVTAKNPITQIYLAGFQFFCLSMWGKSPIFVKNSDAYGHMDFMDCCGRAVCCG